MLSSEEEAIAAARRYADAIAPGAAERDRAGVAPRAELAAFDATGLVAITVPRGDGGPGLGPRILAEVARILAAADPSIAQTPQAHYLFVDGAALLGSPELRERLFADVLAGQRIGNGLAERGTKHTQDLQTRLSRDPHGRLRLTGRKYYCTGALTADWIAITALDDDGPAVLRGGARRICRAGRRRSAHAAALRASVHPGARRRQLLAWAARELDATPARTASTTRWTGNTTTSLRTRSTACCRPTTRSCSQRRALGVR